MPTYPLPREKLLNFRTLQESLIIRTLEFKKYYANALAHPRDDLGHVGVLEGSPEQSSGERNTENK